MEEKVKQRLIGVIVIVGALFIILPFLFHNSRPSADSKLSSNIPNPTVTVALPAASSTTAAPTPATTQNTVIAANTTQTSTQQNGTTTTTTTTGDVNTQPQTPAPDANITTSAPTPDANTAVTTQTPDANTTVTTQTPDANTTTTVQPQDANTVTPVQTPDQNTQSGASASAAVTANSFTQPANALTTGQANEVPTAPAATAQTVAAVTTAATTAQAATPQASTPVQIAAPIVATQSPAKVATPKKVVLKKHEAAKHAVNKERARLAMRATPEAWVIQLGVFSDRENATHLMTKLRSHHLEVFSREVTDNHHRLMAVFVGPEINLQKAEVLKNRLRQEFHLSGEIKKHEA